MSSELSLIEIPKNPFVLALSTPRLSAMKPADAKDKIMDILTKCYFDTGQPMPGVKELKIFAQALLDEVNIVFKACTTGELRLCLNAGVRKEYGEYYGLNIATFSIWLKQFARCEQRNQAQRESEQRSARPLMSETRAFELWKHTILKQFETYKQCGKLDIEFPSFQFKEFERLELICLSIDEKQKLMEAARLQLLEAKRKERLIHANCGHRYEVRQITALIDNIETNNTSSKEQNLIKQMARTIAIKNYYDSVERLGLGEG